MANLNFKICSFNCAGLRERKKLCNVLKLFEDKKADIVMLQETHLLEKDRTYLEKIWKGTVHLSGDRTNSKGLLTLFSKKIDPENIEIIHKDERTLVSTCELDKKTKVVVTNVYAPNNNKDKISYFKQLINILKEKLINRDEYCLICAGDFNTVKDNDMDIISGQPHCDDTVKMFNTFINELFLSDSWRLLHQMSRMHSWRRGNIARRLDYILTDESITSYLQSSNIEPIGFSDHLLVSIQIQLTNFNYGKSYYKMNTSILLNQDYVKMMNREIPKIIDTHSRLDPHLQWEMIKVEIRELSQKFCKKIASKKFGEKQQIKKDLDRLEKQLSINPFDENKIAEQNLKKQKYEEVIAEETRGIRIRCGLKWMEEGEKNTKFFLSLEKKRNAQNTIQEIKKNNGRVITDEGEILSEIGKYYEKIYNNEEENKTNFSDNDFDIFMSDLVIPCLDKEQIEFCDRNFVLEDIAEAIKGMKNGSAPGLDGIPIEFYKIFFNQIQTVLFNCFMFSLEKEKLATSQQRGVLSLLHKGKGLSRDNLDNWRPLSLTNADYKILAKMIARRVQTVLHDIIDKDQCGFVKGRDVSVLLREIDDIIENERDSLSEHILLALDYRKAFDTVSTEYIKKCLNLLGFGPYLRSWIKILLNDRKFRVKNGGHISKDYEMTRGVRQGCPLSPLIFIMSIEFLGLKVRQSDKIKGIRVHKFNVVHKIKQYADDTTFLLNGLTDFREVLSKIKDFSIISGLELNKNKTYAFQLSARTAEINEFEDITFVDKIKLLGIWYSRSTSARNIKDNWEGKINQLERILSLWSKHRLTMIGKVLVIKVFGLSLFIYLMKSIGLPQAVLQKINRIFFAFLWKRNFKEGRTFERVKRKIMCRSIEEGGLDMINMNTMQEGFMIKWSLKLISENNEKWTALPQIYLEQIGNVNTFLCNTSKGEFKGLETIKSEFWREALGTWLTHAGAKNFLGVDGLKFYEQPIFNNKDILYQNKTVFLEEAISKGVFMIKDIVSENNTVISLTEYINKFGLYPRAHIDYFHMLNALNKKIEGLQRESSGIKEKAEHAIHLKNKQIRKILDNDYSEIPCGKKLWERKLNSDISDLYVNSLKCTREVKLRELLFKIYHNIYPTNLILQKIGIKRTNKCAFCQ